MGQLYFLSRAAFQFLLFRRRMNIVKDDKNYRCQYYPRKLGGGVYFRRSEFGAIHKDFKLSFTCSKKFHNCICRTA